MRPCERLRREIGKVIVGNEDVIEYLLICLLAGGHILLESPPGLGKTRMSKALAEAVDMEFKRIQCTPDMSPKDIVGEAPGDRGGLGPIFANIVLVDEINRAQPKTQSAFLEAMGEGTVTFRGRIFRLPDPFMVVATQNPVEYEGTFNLPEAQQDRFLLKAYMRYLTPSEEREVVRSPERGLDVEKVLGPGELSLMRRQVAGEVEVPEEVVDYIVWLVDATRRRREVVVGASTRAAVLFAKAVKAYAYLHGRFKVCVDDVTGLAHPVLRHRLVMNQDSRNFGFTSDDLIDDLLRTRPRWVVADT